ncbi:hypothetical protein Sjap_016847 [Stephania japonica]|uniref:Calcium uniporter protein C-terminal domain-containing protein n=1 Tax=Stephania japonica TaxID=461633 RepID=A0AAP0NHR4_9MAGN
MALRRLFQARRLFSRISTSSLSLPPPPPLATYPMVPRLDKDQDSINNKNGFLERFLQRRELVQSAFHSEIRDMPIGDKLMEKLKGMNLGRDRLRFDGLVNPSMKKVSVEDARKLLRFSQMEMLKSKLRQIPKSCISYSEFIEICKEGSSLNPQQGLEFAKMLDESGTVIVLGNVVFLHPDQIVKAIEGAIQMPQQNGESRKAELATMEKEKKAIDMKADSMVRREMWCGLGLLVVQTVGFMRLTFWDLSWDVMEPICFFATSTYVILGYLFFLRTSRDPSFEGLFQSRFSAKQRRLMKEHKFDMERFQELQRVVLHPFSAQSSSFSNSKSHS